MPDEVHLQPAAPSAAFSEANGPFVAYFASGYCPDEHEACSFKVHRNTKRPREYCLVTEKVCLSLIPSLWYLLGIKSGWKYSACAIREH